jgi:hypothetical protein
VIDDGDVVVDVDDGVVVDDDVARAASLLCDVASRKMALINGNKYV